MAKKNIKKSVKNTNVRLSATDIKNTFIKINDQIQSLHECSNNDFFALNNSFKNNYNVSCRVIGNSKLLIKLINENPSYNLFNDFSSFQENIISLYNSINDKITHLIEYLNTLDTSCNSLNFPLNTINQNLLAFDFLISNFNMFHPVQTKYTFYIHKLIQKTKIQFDKLLNLINLLNNKIGLIKNKAEDLADSVHLVQEKLEIELDEVKRILEVKKNLTEAKLQEIDTQSSLSNHFNDIITNLQYHDILCQKMEHIQKIYNDVIEKLQIFEKSGNMLDNPEQVEDCLLYVKEISELQSAQLLHVNKKYQVAIQIISENITKMDENVTKVNNITQDVLGYSSKNNSNFILSITNNIDNIYKKFLEIYYIFVELTGSLKEFKNIQDDFIHGLNQAITYLNNFKHLADNFVQAIDNIENTDIQVQFNNLLKDILVTKQLIDRYLNTTISLINSIHSDNSSIQVIDKAQSSFLIFADIFIQKLKIHSRESSQKLNENKNLCRNITSNIQHSLKQVKYYDFFEQIIENIIIELNSLNKSIISNLKFSSGKKSEKLSNLKKHYTTGSEHNIHNIFVEFGKNESISYRDETDENNIEIF